jgi:hypothetical protein
MKNYREITNEYFSNKLDESKNLEIVSAQLFFEFFQVKKIKCNLLIPDTFIFQDGKLNFLFIFFFFRC